MFASLCVYVRWASLVVGGCVSANVSGVLNYGLLTLRVKSMLLCTVLYHSCTPFIIASRRAPIRGFCGPERERGMKESLQSTHKGTKYKKKTNILLPCFMYVI